MDLNDKKVLVVGAGISGVAAVRLLCKKTAKVTLNDGNTDIDPEKLKKDIGDDAEYDLILGEISDEKLRTFDLAVISPGISTEILLVKRLKENNIPVWGEIELAYVCGAGDVIAITGTNGKTTTTTLVGEIMKAYFDDVYVVGNIGLPYTEYADKMTKDTVTVAEISSFQLETVHTFRPRVSAILNITPDHLNRHHTMERYAEAKYRITANQGKDDYCILNYEDERLREASLKIKSTIVWFSSENEVEKGAFLDDGAIYYTDRDADIQKIKICDVTELRLLGRHNYENVMAAVCMAVCMGVDIDIIRKVCKGFKAVEHRIEFVDEINGIKYYNDSKGTNPDAAIKAVEAMITPTIVIGGGYDKDSSYEQWIDSFGDKVKGLVLLGQTRDKIAEAAKRCGFEPVVRVNDLKEAVEKATQMAAPGYAVLLSPACASWGMFKNFEQRGDMFKRYVYELKD